MLRSHKPEVVALLETKVTLNSMGMFFNSFGFTASTHVDPSGRVGGIWVLWDPTKVTLNTTHISVQAIHATVRKDGFEEWIFSAIYASPNARLRDTLWEDMEDLAASNQLPWMAAGDFNDVVSLCESKTSSSYLSSSQRRKFSENINKCNLVDMGSAGPKFTWTNGRQGPTNVQKRLDRALCNENWRTLFPEGMTLVLPRTYSDHIFSTSHLYSW